MVQHNISILKQQMEEFQFDKCGKRRYPIEFKRQVVQLVIESGDKPAEKGSGSLSVFSQELLR